jgi:hypothetical protein
MELTTMLYASCLLAANSFLDRGHAHHTTSLSLLHNHVEKLLGQKMVDEIDYFAPCSHALRICLVNCFA